MKKRPVGILGATGMVGQRFASLLVDHPWFEVVSVAASPQSKGLTYKDALAKRGVLGPNRLSRLVVHAVQEDMDLIADRVDVVFCALDLDKGAIRDIEEAYAKRGAAVISNNSAHRWTEDVPMIIPEVNPEHVGLIDIQQQNRGWEKGLIVVKPNCSIQSYVAVLTALKEFDPQQATVTSLQAISGAGKTFESWPEMMDNVIPFIAGEEEKSEKEPLKIWGNLTDKTIQPAKAPVISATCIRVPISDGHMANVNVSFSKQPTEEQIVAALQNYKNPIRSLNLPSAPKQFIKYLEQDDRPQIKLDREFENGMGITVGRLRPGPESSWQFVSLSHNTLRGAAGGAVLTAELLATKNYL